ncbi:hypothetical protein QBC40DRAFT_222294 [Triangularia verruculosa]|uniref:Uncharacterized protein n=1 Tax=Triangularia verruculosa TaxID=2587418 RepID=A0AAN7AWC7_9PEZI|nr:hypothetical protein QBC40DRAFT_222294 [Triangularia verruculosa]
MFDDSFSQSRIYFQLLHLLRIAPQWMKETKEDLMEFRQVFKRRPLSGWSESPCDSVKFDKIVEQNWDKIILHFDDLRSRLERRIEVKADEIRGLRDGILSATNLLEASKLTSMNRHIIIFTVVTIFYLPLGFVTAVYSMSLIQDEALSHLKGPYVGSMLSVAALTYMVSIAVVFFVDRKKIIPWLLQRIPETTKKKPWFRTACTKIGIELPEIKPPLPPNPTPATPRPPGFQGVPAVKAEEKPPPKGWGSFWPKGGLDLRRRKKAGNEGPAVAV